MRQYIVSHVKVTDTKMGFAPIDVSRKSNLDSSVTFPLSSLEIETRTEI